jgi:hypothetical protein
MYAKLAQYVAAKLKAVELATDPVVPSQSKLVVAFVRAAPQATIRHSGKRRLAALAPTLPLLWSGGERWLLP